MLRLIAAAHAELGGEHGPCVGCGPWGSDPWKRARRNDYEPENEILWVNRKGRRLTKIGKGRQVGKIMFSLVNLLGENACYEMKEKIFLWELFVPYPTRRVVYR